MTAAADLVLVRAGGVLVSVGAICAYPVGFEFYLSVGFDEQAGWRARPDARSRLLGFHVRTPEERASASRILVGFSDGRKADSAACMTGAADPGEFMLRYSGGESAMFANAPVLRAESRWWVSPLPAPGQVEFSVCLHGAAEPDGTAVMDAAPIIEAASRSQVLWPAPETEPI